VKTITGKLVILFLVFLFINLLFFSSLLFENQMDLVSGYAYYKSLDFANGCYNSLADLEKRLVGQANIDPLSFQAQVLDALNFYSKGFAVFDERGNIRSVYNLDRDLADSVRFNVFRSISNRDLYGKQYYSRLGERGDEMLLFFPIELAAESGRVIMVRLPLDEITAYRWTIMRILLIIGLGMALFYALFAFIVNHVIVRPVKLLNGTTMEIRGGDLSRRVEMKSRDEIGQLGESFNAMADNLERTITGLDHRIEIMEMELDTAQTVQAGIYPDIAETDLFDFSSHHSPLTRVSGDFYDIFKLDDNRIGVLVADVSGHGVAAALITMLIKNVAGREAHRFEDPAEFLQFLNTGLQDLKSRYNSFFTAFYAIFEAGGMRYANALHPPALHIAGDGTVTDLDTEGYLVGVSPLANEHYKSDSRKLAGGDKIVLFSDGIFEVFGPDKTIYGTERIRKTVEEAAHLDHAGLFQAILDGRAAFAGDTEQTDDETLLVLQVK
jgi:serine phosphatase RsbU (regulator of sigma subunit)